MMVPGNQSGEKLMTALFKPGLVAEEEATVKEKAKEVVEFLNLGHLSNELAGNLSGGQKKLLELGRTMMVDAKLVLLDCLLYTSPSPRDGLLSRMPSSA